MTAPGNPDNTNGTTATPSSTAPTSGEASNTGLSGRAPAHSRFAGRSAEEILGIAEALADVATRFNQPVPQAQPQPQASRFDLDIADDEYVSGAKLRQIVSQVVNQPAPVDHEARRQNALNAWGMAQIKYPDEFRRWEPEIRNEASKLDISYWNLDTLGQIIRIVRSNHIDELAAEKAQRLVSESHPTIRSGTGGLGGVPQTQRTLADDALPQGWVEQAKAKGITEATVLEFCQITGQTPEQYLASVEQYGKGAVIRG